MGKIKTRFDSISLVMELEAEVKQPIAGDCPCYSTIRASLAVHYFHLGTITCTQVNYLKPSLQVVIRRIQKFTWIHTHLYISTCCPFSSP
jgi:hypothetical protein